VEQKLIKKLQNKSAIIGIVGLGYVVLPLALRFTETGFHVIGFDIDSDKIKALDAGRSYIKHIPSERIGRAVTEKTLAVTTDFVRAKEADALIICVPTSLNRHREPDLSFVIKTTESLAPHLRKGQAVSLESTTYPGTTEEEIKPIIERRGLVVGKDIFLVYSPEREDPGNPEFYTQKIPKVCGGVTKTVCAWEWLFTAR